ncbi:MAG: C4-type zinc ribbon domain-containing protein [Actinomycetota bacterium]
MNADTTAQLRLLDVQAADTAVAQLAHRRSTLPELAAIAVHDQQIEAMDLEALELRTKLADIDGEQRRLEHEVDAVRGRAARDEQRLTAGGLPAKELEGLQHEVATLARRQATLEDDLLEVMEQRESVDTELAGVTKRREAADGERAALIQARDAAFAAIGAASATNRAQRDAIAAEIPEDLLALYDKVRAANGGVGAAMLRQRRCEGCRIELAGNEQAAVRAAAPDLVLRCENCRRILVRTAESGL